MRKQIQFWLVLVLVGTWLFASQVALVREMTSPSVREAIALGIKQKQFAAYKIQEKARFSWPPFIAYYTTPFRRVALAAHTAHIHYKDFTEKDVATEMLAQEIQVYAPSQQSRGAAIANVETIVIMPRDSKDRSKAVQPLRTEEASEAYKNLLGFTGEGRGLIAVFPLDVWNEENEIHVVFDREIPGSHGWAATGGCTDCKSRIYLDNIR